MFSANRAVYEYTYIDLDHPWDESHPFESEHPRLPERFADLVAAATSILCGSASAERQQRLIRYTEEVEFIVDGYLLRLGTAAHPADPESGRDYVTAYRCLWPTSKWLEAAYRAQRPEDHEKGRTSGLAVLFAAASLRDADEALVAYYDPPETPYRAERALDWALGASHGLLMAKTAGTPPSATQRAALTQEVRSAIARAAANGRHAITYEVRAKAIELYVALQAQRQTPMSKLQASKKILPEVLQFAAERGWRLSEERAGQTVYDWLRKAE